MSQVMEAFTTSLERLLYRLLDFIRGEFSFLFHWAPCFFWRNKWPNKKQIWKPPPLSLFQLLLFSSHFPPWNALVSSWRNLKKRWLLPRNLQISTAQNHPHSSVLVKWVRLGLNRSIFIWIILYLALAILLPSWNLEPFRHICPGNSTGKL